VLSDEVSQDPRAISGTVGSVVVVIRAGIVITSVAIGIVADPGITVDSGTSTIAVDTVARAATAARRDIIISSVVFTLDIISAASGNISISNTVAYAVTGVITSRAT
jgi:hypothetical protein